MYEDLYVRYANGLYQLRIVGTHFCLSCADTFDKVVSKAKQYQKKFRETRRLLNVIRDTCEDGGRVAKLTFEHLEEEYNEGLHLPYTKDLQQELREYQKECPKLRRVTRAYTNLDKTPTPDTEVNVVKRIKKIIRPKKKIPATI